MKKVYLLLCALVACVGATWAAPITALSDAVVGKVFTIRSQNRGAFVYDAKNEGYVSGSARSGYGTLDNTDKNFLFAFVKEGDNFFLYSIGAGKYAAYAGDGVALQDAAPAAGVSFLASTGGTKDQFPTVIAIDGSHQLNMSADQKKGILTDWNNTGDVGNMLAIEEVDGCEIDNSTRVFTDNRIRFTYSYKYNGTELATQAVVGVVGSAYPTPSQTLTFGIEAITPAGTIQASDADNTVEVACKVSDDFPFEYFSSYEDITTWYGAKLHSNQTHWMKWTGSAIAFTDGELPAGDAAYAWGFVGDPINGFKVYNKSAGGDVMLDDSNPCSLSAGDFVAKAGASRTNTMADGYFTLKFDGQEYLNYQSGQVKRWWDNDEGSTWKLQEMDLSADAAAKAAKAEALALINTSSILFGSADVDGTLANVAKKAIDGYTYNPTLESDVAAAVAFYNEKVNEMCAAVDKEVAFYNKNRGTSGRYMVVRDAILLEGAEAGGTAIFRVKGVAGTNHFTIQNLANERYIPNTSGASSRIQLSLTPGEFTIKSFGEDNNFAFICTTPEDSRHNSLHLDGGYKVVVWEADNATNASVWEIQEPTHKDMDLNAGKERVKNQALEAALTLKNSLNAIQIGDKLGEYTASEEALAAYQAAKAAIPEAAGNRTFEELLPLKDNLQTAYNALQIVQPNGRAFVISGKKTGRFLTMKGVATSGENANRLKMVAGQANADIFLLTEANEMVSYTQGYGLTKSEEVAPVGDAINTMTFTNGAAVSYYTIRSNHSGNIYLYDNQNKDVLCSNNVTADDNTDWTLTEVSELPIKMNLVGGAYYATFNAPVRVVIPAGLKAYSASVEDGSNVMTLTKVVEDGVLEANTPVILYSASNVASLAISRNDGTAASSNVLSGTNQKILNGSDNYVLGKNNEDVVGFYKYTAANVPAFKVYMHMEGGAEGRAFSFRFSDIETAIDAIEGDNSSNAVIYDLAGRRVQKAAKGLYIVNGKKVMYN